MKLLFVASGKLPHPTGNGSSVLGYGLLSCFRKLGYSVTIVPTILIYGSPEEEARHVGHLLEIGCQITSLGIEKGRGLTRGQMVRQFFFPTDRIYFPARNHEAVFVEFVRDLDPDIVFALSWHALSLTALLDKGGPRHIVSIVDQIGQYTALYRRTLKLSRGRQKLKRSIIAFGMRKKGEAALKYLPTADLIIEHAWHHAEELRSMGFNNVHYMPHPLPTIEIGSNGVHRERGQEQVVNVLIAGSLKGVASVLGFEFFLDKVLPHFDRLRRARELPRYRFRIVGHGRLVDPLKDRLCDRDDVEFVGFVQSIEREFLMSDLLLVTIPVKHGFRTRIAEAFSYGLCVVAHEGNCAGIKEAIPGTNILSSNDPEELASLIISAINDPELRDKIGRAGRETFVNEMSSDVAVRTLKTWIDNLDDERPGTSVSE